MNKLPNRIRELREARNMCIPEFAKKCETSTTQISRLELGGRKLTEDWMRRIAPHLGVEPWELLSEAAGAPSNSAARQELRKLITRWASKHNIPPADVANCLLFVAEELDLPLKIKKAVDSN